MGETTTMQKGKTGAAAPMLRVESLYCERDDRVLFQDLNFQLGHGQVLQIKGNNGTGKTTLLRILCGLNDNYEGDIFWYGDSIRQHRDTFFASLPFIRNQKITFQRCHKGLGGGCRLLLHHDPTPFLPPSSKVCKSGTVSW